MKRGGEEVDGVGVLMKDTDALEAGVDDGFTDGVDGVYTGVEDTVVGDGVVIEVEVEVEVQVEIEVEVEVEVKVVVKVDVELESDPGIAVATGSVPSGQVSGGIA